MRKVGRDGSRGFTVRFSLFASNSSSSEAVFETGERLGELASKSQPSEMGERGWGDPSWDAMKGLIEVCFDSDCDSKREQSAVN